MKKIKLKSKHLQMVLFAIVVLFIGGLGGYYISTTHAANNFDTIVGIDSKCLDNHGNLQVNYNKINLWSCNGTGAQQWTVNATATSPGTIVNANGFCLDVDGDLTAAFTKVDLYQCNGTTAQDWIINTTADTIINPHSNLCLDDFSALTTNGNQIDIYPCNGTAAQKWVITQPSISTPPPTTPPPPVKTPPPVTPPPSTTPPPPSTSTSLFTPPSGKTYIGVQSANGNIASFESAAGITTHPAIVGNYTAADGPLTSVLTQYGNLPTNEAVMVSWNVPMTGGQITSGKEDAYLEAQAAAAKAYGKPIFLRPDWEMNGTWYSDYDTAGGTTPAEYVASWQHIYNIFKNAGVTNTTFVWSTNGGDISGEPVSSSWYPGNSYVGWIAVDVYPQFGGSAQNALTGHDEIDSMLEFAAANGKPFMVSEWGPNSTSAYSDSTLAFDTIFANLETTPDTQFSVASVNPSLASDKSDFAGLMYFNFGGAGSHNATDFLLIDHPTGAAAFRTYTVNKSNFLDAIN